MILAVVLALVAGGAAYYYLHDVQARAYKNATLTPVYVVEKPIAQGTPAADVVSKGLVKKSQIPQQFKPADAVLDLATIQGEIAVANLTPGEVLTNGLFVGPAAASNTVPAAIPKGDIAITVSVGSVQSVAGLVQPGDLVDILVQLNSGSEHFLYQNAHVLAVGTSVAMPQSNGSTAASGTGGGSGLITFAVPPVAAERLALIQSGGGNVAGGSLYLALVPRHNKPHHQPPVNAGNLIPASVTP